MGQVSLFMLLCLSLPEAVLYLPLMLLFAGEKEHLNFRQKGNIFRFVVAVVLMLLTTIFVRPHIISVPLSAFAHYLAYIIILRIIYNISLHRAFFSITLIASFCILFENLLIPFVIIFFAGNQENFMQNNMAMLISSIPIRLFQIVTILFMWKYYVIFVSTKLNKRIYLLLSFILSAIFIAELLLSYLLVSYLGIMSGVHKIFYVLSLLLMVFFNFLIFKLIFEVMKWMVEGGTKQYQSLEDDSRWFFEKVDSLLSENDVSGARALIGKLKSKIEE